MGRVVNWEAYGVEWDAVSDLIGRIYECALDPALWDDTLARIVSTFSPHEWDVAMLLWESLRPPQARFVGAVGLHPVIRDVYLNLYAGRNLWSELVLRQKVGRVIDTADYIAPSAFRETPIYDQFFKNWRMDRALVALLDRNGSEKLGLLLPGTSEQPIEGLKRGLRLIAPHLQRAVRIREHLGAANLRAASAEAVLDGQKCPLITLDHDLRLVHLTPAAAELQTDGVFRFADGRLDFADRTANRRLADLMTLPESPSVAFTVEHEVRGAINVLASRVGSGSGDGLFDRPGFMVCLGLGPMPPLIEIDRLRAWFGLTPAEGRLVASLSAGISLQEYARQRNVSVAAGRYLLKSVFRKLEVGSQVELVARLRSLPG